MTELRWVKKVAGKYYDGAMVGTDIYHDAVLQYRIVTNQNEIGTKPPIWSEWIDVPTEWMPPNTSLTGAKPAGEASVLKR